MHCAATDCMDMYMEYGDTNRSSYLQDLYVRNLTFCAYSNNVVFVEYIYNVKQCYLALAALRILKQSLSSLAPFVVAIVNIKYSNVFIRTIFQSTGKFAIHTSQNGVCIQNSGAQNMTDEFDSFG